MQNRNNGDVLAEEAVFGVPVANPYTAELAQLRRENAELRATLQCIEQGADTLDILSHLNALHVAMQFLISEVRALRAANNHSVNHSPSPPVVEQRLLSAAPRPQPAVDRRYHNRDQESSLAAGPNGLFSRVAEEPMMNEARRRRIREQEARRAPGMM